LVWFDFAQAFRADTFRNYAAVFFCQGLGLGFLARKAILVQRLSWQLLPKIRTTQIFPPFIF
jgi:hypothetical protein